MANKEQLVSGLRHLSLALPLMFAGPTFYFILGRQALKDGTYFWAIVSLLIMAAAVFFMVKGIRKLLKGFWGEL
jgi:large-conductance mechanosensitive channel